MGSIRDVLTALSRKNENSSQLRKYLAANGITIAPNKVNQQLKQDEYVKPAKDEWRIDELIDGKEESKAKISFTTKSGKTYKYVITMPTRNLKDITQDSSDAKPGAVFTPSGALVELITHMQRA